jgi:hypothetical protein
VAVDDRIRVDNVLLRLRHLDDPADFTCDPRLPGGFALMCTACIDYYNKNGYVSCGYGPFSNASAMMTTHKW